MRRLRIPIPRWHRIRAVPGIRLAAQRLRRIPWAWKTLTLLQRGVSEFRDDHCPQLAAALAFHLLFAMFPLAIMVIGIIGLITRDPQALETVTNAVVKVVPLSDHGRQQLRTLLGSLGGGAGALGLLGLLGVLWSASGAMAAIRTALNIAWDTDVKRPFVRGKLIDLVLIIGVFLALGAIVGLTIAANIVTSSAANLPQSLHGLAPVTGAAATVAVVIVSIALLFATFAFLYRFVPAVPTRMRGIWPGALTAAVGFEALLYGFSLYVSYFSSYNKVYGSLGAVIAFMLFVYLTAMVFLFGAEIASEYPRMRAAPPEP